MIERDDHDPVGHRVALHQRDDPLVDAGVRPGAALDLDVQDAAGARPGQHLVQARDLLAGVVRAGVDAGVEPLHFGEGLVSDVAPAVGGPLQPVIVDNHHLVVGGQVDVKLDDVGALRQGKLERRERVLWRIPHRASVPEHAGEPDRAVLPHSSLLLPVLSAIPHHSERKGTGSGARFDMRKASGGLEPAVEPVHDSVQPQQPPVRPPAPRQVVVLLGEADKLGGLAQPAQ